MSGKKENLGMRSKLVYGQLLAFGFLLTIGAWTAGTFVKMYLVERMVVDLYPWAAGYFNPHMSKLVNYCFTCAAFAIFYFIFLSDAFINLLKSKMNTYRPAANIFFIVLITTVLLASKPFGIVFQLVSFLAAGICSLLYLCFPELFLKARFRHG